MNQYQAAIIDCESYDENILASKMNSILEAIDGLSFVRPGMTIAIKTNLVTAAEPEKAVVTHPALLKVLIQMILERGASVVIGDSPGGPWTEARMKKIYQASGMDQMIAQLNDHKVSLNMNLNQTQASFPQGKVMKTLAFTSWLKEADAIICVCKLKTHGMMTLSANAKNMFGSIPGTTKLEYHYRFPDHQDFANMLIDINEFLKPCLYITDAVVGMEGNGPNSGTPRQIGAILAGRNPYLLDNICARIMGVEPDRVPILKAALERELYQESLPVWGDPSTFFQDNYVIPETRNIEFGGKIPQPLVPLVRKILQSKPQVKKSECIGCQKCMQVCPAKAIVMKNMKPVIDRNQCIRCFCCQEFCPKGAMIVHRPMVARLLSEL